jgi:hypothetical protein
MHLAANQVTSENDANIPRAIAIVTDQLAVEEGKLNDMRDKSRHSAGSEEIERRRNDLIREQAWRQNGISVDDHDEWSAYEFNRLLGLGNQLLMARQGWLTFRSDFLRLTSTKANRCS